ncbi:hypothetical protein PHMEG_0008176 [Phytophthora megakarya]|uniref:RxLR effector protein n=1 Tax=Phytophthora megakarya TaxID=4795 RepID=A0A225WLF7_9STRA|nr:hypothetical protein PHMEG_0008176 [Phytophthora megakarya]
MKLLDLLSVLIILSVVPVHGRTSNIEGSQVYRKAPSRPNVAEVLFTNEEESLLRGQENDLPYMLAARLPGKTPVDVQKRCFQLGLRCGGDVKPPARNSEKWRTPRRDRARSLEIE